jgi:hypothetical protein
MKKFILFFLILFVSGIAYSQPTYQVTLQNGFQVSPTVYQFDVYVERTGTTAFELATFQMGLLFNNAVKNGGTLTGAISGSQLLPSQVPASINTAATYVVGATTYGVVKLAPKSPPGAGSGTIIPVAPGLRVATITLTNSVPFGPYPWNFTFNFTAQPYNTVVSAYFGGVNTVITNPASHINSLLNDPMPIELTSFTGNVGNKRDITLNWNTATETNNKGFDIERKTITTETWSKVGYIDGKGTTTTPTSYRYEDRNLNTGKYNYRLKQMDYNGNFKYYDLNGLIEVGVPNKYDLSQNYPNPFNPTTKIDFDLPFDSKVSMKLFDMSGREVMTLVNDQRTAGYYTVTFNMSNFSSGAYFYRINAEGSGQNYVMTKKMMLIK